MSKMAFEFSDVETINILAASLGDKIPLGFNTISITAEATRRGKKGFKVILHCEPEEKK